VRPGTNVTFSVTATGTQPLSYQWRKDGANLGSGGRISGATSPSLTISNVVESDSGQYSVLVTNTVNSVLSSNAALLVTSLDHFTWSQIPSPQFTNAPFPVTIQARNTTNGVVSNFVGTVATSGSAGSNSVPVMPSVSGNFIQGVWTGSVNVASLASNLVLRADDGVGHTGLSNPFQVVSPSQVPVITAQPVNVAARQGTTVTFNVTAAGAPPLSYQWQKAGVSLVDGGKISGAATPSLTISNVANKDAGSYSVLVTNNYGSTLSSNATLVILRGKGAAGALSSSVSSTNVAPELELGFDGTRLLILWPADSAWTLESSTDLSPSSWVQPPDAPQPIGDLYAVPLATPDAKRFYRLRRTVP